ncbi:PaaI family thioesterase [Pararhodobacter zhoushanensis]|uniref:PaaI family thioesterase n=1 Tax=Pararhodobacter zhoushanensis TaxID=2479545 RepID=UPI000F8DD921|nr:PaaI family thioesterase [Pararhodobacter zhoushanensis]
MDDFTAIEAAARASFASQTMMQTMGAALIETGPGRCVIRAPIAPHLKQQHGAAHAGLAFTIGDSAAGYAALTLMGLESDVMTVEMKINLLSPAIGDALEAVGEVVRAGKRLTVVRAEVFALTGENRKSIALLQGTMIPVAQRA